MMLLIGCGNAVPVPNDQRLILVFDPTILRGVPPATFRSLVADKIRTSFKDLPEDTFVDVYLVQIEGTGLPVDIQGSLPFNAGEPTEDGHLARATALGDSVARFVEERWSASSEEPNRPSSCILSTLYRAQEMVKNGKKRSEDVTLVVISDLLEACSEPGRNNFERMIPDSLGPLPVEADLSGADRVLMLRVNTAGTVALNDDPKLVRLWTQLLGRWKVDEGKVEFRSDFPSRLVEPLASQH